jgi:hypothetical protein
MIRWRWNAVALTLLGGCATQPMQERPMTAADMPVQLTLAGLSDPTPELKRFYDGRAGTEARVMQVESGDRFAVVGYLTTVGDYVFTKRSVRSWVGGLLSEEMLAKATWHDGGTLSDGGIRTDWQAFDLAEDARCLGLSRPLRQHYEAAGRGEASQEMVVSVYCRSANAPLDAAAAREVASAIRVTR